MSKEYDKKEQVKLICDDFIVFRICIYSFTSVFIQTVSDEGSMPKKLSLSS